MDSRLRINVHNYILFFRKYIYTLHRKRPDPIQTDMFMHTNVCTVRELNPQPLAQEASIRTIAPVVRLILIILQTLQVVSLSQCISSVSAFSRLYHKYIYIKYFRHSQLLNSSK
jgi:hypothetical protein